MLPYLVPFCCYPEAPTTKKTRDLFDGIICDMIDAGDMATPHVRRMTCELVALRRNIPELAHARGHWTREKYWNEGTETDM
jgi:hypothetical protein